MFSQRLSSLRKEHKKTQQNIADFLGITRPAYTAYESGKREPDFDTLQKLANYFDVSTDYLLGRSDIKNPEKQPEGRFFYDLDHASQDDLDELENYFRYLQERKKKRENKDGK